MKDKRAEIQSETPPAAQMKGVPVGENGRLPPPSDPALEPESPMDPGEFLQAVRSAVAAGMDPVEVQQILERVPADPALLNELAALMDDPTADPTLQGYAAEALVCAGTPESMRHVLDELLNAARAGDEERIRIGTTALESPTTLAGLHVLFDCLLGRGAYADPAEPLPPEALAAVRKALLAAPDREEVGELAAKLYLDSDAATDEAAMWELFEGVSHPVMLAKLAARAYEEKLEDNAALFMQRLGESDEQGVVQAIVQMTSAPAVLLDDAAAALYEWSLRHPEDALPGLFVEYLSDLSLPPDQRSVSAFGLAGTADPEFARQALAKALAHETDPAVRLDLQTALMLLEQNRKP